MRYSKFTDVGLITHKWDETPFPTRKTCDYCDSDGAVHRRYVYAGEPSDDECPVCHGDCGHFGTIRAIRRYRIVRSFAA